MAQSVPWILALLALYWLARFYEGGTCLRCGGRGRHRQDCPLRRDDGA